MHSLEQTTLKRARWAYERARLTLAVWVAVPVSALVVVAIVASPARGQTAALGVSLTAFGIAAVWWGRGVERSVLPGVLAGAFPLVMSLCATRFGHVLLGPACMPLCYGASVAGGIGAGLIVGRWFLLGQRAPVSVLLAASAFGLLTGSMGSSCVGVRGVMALLVGFVVSLSFQAARVKWSRS